MSLTDTITGYPTGHMDPDEAVVLEAQAAGDPDIQARIDAQREAAPDTGPAADGPQAAARGLPNVRSWCGVYCRSSTGKVLANGHRARREVANMDPAQSGPGPALARPRTAPTSWSARSSARPGLARGSACPAWSQDPGWCFGVIIYFLATIAAQEY